MKVIVISGQAQVGKNTFINFCKEGDYDVYDFSTIDYVKEAAKQIGWDGEKDNRGRRLLSDLKDCLTRYADIPFKKVVSISDGNSEIISAILQEGMQIQINDETSSIMISGRLTDKDWEKLKVLCKTKNIRSVDLSNAVCDSIPGGAFWGRTALTSILIPNSVISIGNRAFYNSGLTSITIPQSVTNIGSEAFAYCKGLTSIVIPNSVNSISNAAFAYCKGLTSITIPQSVTIIGKGAFEGCSRLTSVTIPNSVTSIGYSAFCNCIGLTSMTIGNSVASIGESAFYGCTGLTSVTIPNSVTSIGEYAFCGCSGLAIITIPNSVTIIGKGAFKDCYITIYVPKGTLNRFDKNKIQAGNIIEEQHESLQKTE